MERTHRTFVLGILLGAAWSLSAQLNVDSVERLLHVERAPIERLKLLRQLTRSPDPPTSHRYSIATIALADSLLLHGYAGDPAVLSLKAAGQWNFGQSRFYHGPDSNQDSLFLWYTRAAQTWQESGDKDRIAFSTMVLADWLIHRGDAQGALVRLKTCLTAHQELGDTMGMARDHGSIGQAYYNLGDRPRALDHYGVAVTLAKHVGNARLGAGSLCNIGLIYQEQGQADTAVAYYERSIKAYKTEPDYPGWITPLSNIVNLMSLQGRRADALRLADEALMWPDLEQFPDEATGLYTTLGAIYREAGEQEKAIHFAEKTVQMAERGSSSSRLVSALTELGRALQRQGDPSGALRQALRARSLCDSLQMPFTDRSAVARLLSDLYDASGRTAEAFQYYKEHVALDDSVQGEDIRKKIRQLDLRKQAMADSLSYAAERSLQEKEIQKQKVIRNGFMLGFALVIAFAGVFLFQRNRIAREKERSEMLLLNILPAEVAEELKAKGEADAKLIDQVTVLFTDFKGFTAMSETLSPRDLVRDLNECFSAFDHIMEKHNIEKIKTIGDAYMAAGGLPTPNSTHATDVVKAAFEIRDFIAEGKARKVAVGLPYFEIRIGIHTGPVVAGIVGVKKFSYDIWGDTVNTASRMESSGEVGQVNISEATYALVKNEAGLTFTPRGKVQAKGKGELEMYFVARSPA